MTESTPESPPESNNDETTTSNDPAAESSGRDEEEKTSDPVEDSDSDDDDDDDDETSSTKSDDSSEGKKEKEDPELALMKAMACKEEGNNFFSKEKDFEKASRAYRRGVNSLKNLNKANTGDDQVKALLLTLQTNLSMMSFKLGKHRQSRDVATKALEIDPDHVKARYRRAVAHRKLGDPEEAMADLKAALAKDPTNSAVRKEFASLQKETQKTKKAQKASLRKAFSKGGLLNDDRVEDEATKAKRQAKEKKEKEEALKKRKKEWEDDCVSRMAKGEEAISYEDWDKEKIAEQKAKEEEAEKKRKEDEKRRKEVRRRRKAATKEEDSDDDEDVFTEKELAAMRGYKKTADGRITSYFTREQSAEEKAMLDIAPKQIGSGDGAPQPLAPSPASGGESGSAWNHAGTWEEKDTTEWCKNHLEKRLLGTEAEATGADGGTLHGCVTKVENMTGDASVAVVGGKKRYIFDLHCKLVFEVKDFDTGDVLASGQLRLPDICSTHHEELEVLGGGWKKAPTGSQKGPCEDCRSKLVAGVRESVRSWVKDFNEQY